MTIANSRLIGARVQRFVWSYAAIWMTSLVAGPRTAASQTFVNVAFLAMGGITVATEFRLATHPRVTWEDRRAWWCVATSSLLSWLAGGLWTAELMSGTPTSSLPAFAELSPWIASLGLLQLRRGRGLSWTEPRARLEAALFAIAIVVMCWHFTVRPWFDAATPIATIDVVQGVGGWIELAVLSLAYIRSAGETRRHWIALLLAAGVADAFSSHVWQATTTSYLPGHWVDGLFFASWFVEWRAAVSALGMATSGTSAHSGAGSDGALPSLRTTYPSGTAPSVFVAGAYVLLLVTVREGDSADTLAIATVVIAMTVLLLARQRIELSDNRRLNAAIAVNASRFRAVIEHAKDDVFVVASDGTVRHASPSALTQGRGAESERWTARFDADTAARLEAWLERPEDDQAGVRVSAKQAGGSLRTFALRSQDRRADPHLAGWVVTARDVTAEAQLEERLRHSQKLHAVSEMAGRVAHSYNNALAAVRGYADLLEEDLGPQSPRFEDVQHIQAAANRGAAITRQLLGFSGTSVSRIAPLDARDMAEGLRPMLEQLLQPHVGLTIQIPATPLPLMADRTQLEQVVTNLVTNARDAMPDGGTVDVVWRDGSELGMPESVLLDVRDTGIGIAQQHLERIFTPFFTTKSPGRGTGLGLAMVDAIVRRAGGTGRVDSVVGHGTTMRVTLPRADLLVGEQRATLSAAVDKTARAFVLLVDDEDDVRRVTRRMLERGGYAVHDVSHGRAAVTLADNHAMHIDLVVTDLMMPGVSGRDVVEAFRRTRPHVPVVCITGYASAAVGGDSLGAMVHSVVEKPFTSAQLLDAVASGLRGAVAH